jgi:hypothetical protein
MARVYWMLCTRDNGKWSPQFGDHDRATVAQEERDEYMMYGAKDRKIIRCPDDTAIAVKIALARLNQR